MKEKIKKIISSKFLTVILLTVNIIFAFSYTITGAITFGQHLGFLLGNVVMIFILFAIYQSITEKNHIYSLNLAIIIYWIIYFVIYLFKN